MLLKTFAPLVCAGIAFGAKLPRQPKLFKKETEKLNQALSENQKAIEEIQDFDDNVEAFFNAPGFARKFVDLDDEQKALVENLKKEGYNPLKRAKKQYARLAETIQMFDAKVDQIAAVLGDEFQEMFDIEVDPCLYNQCANNSTCVGDIQGNDDGLDYFCNCPAGYDGQFCDNNIDDCVSNACVNGSCVDGIDSYSCSCDAGWDGEFCDNNIDDCAGNNCANGSVCVDGVAGYTCSCAAGYSGQFCENNNDDCAGNNCANGSTCVDGVDGYTCSCVAGFSGQFCETNNDDCAGNNCANGSVCVDGVDGYTCSCAAGYDGQFCENNVDDCAGNNCANGSVCVDGVAGYTCSCAAGYDGQFCENNVDDCAGNNCANGSTCVDGIESYTCTCPPGYTGQFCETNNDDCASNKCANGGTCVDGVNAYTCSCKAGWVGDLCNVAADKVSLTNPRWGVDGTGLDNAAYTLPAVLAIDGFWAIHKDDGSNQFDFNFNGYTHSDDNQNPKTFSVDFANPNTPIYQIVLYTDPRPVSLNAFNYYDGLVVKVGNSVCTTTAGLDDASYATNRVTYRNEGIVFNCNGAVGNSIVLEYAAANLAFAEIVAYSAPKLTLTNPRWGVDGTGLDNAAYTLPAVLAIDGFWAIHKDDGSNQFDFNFNGYTHNDDNQNPKTFSVDFATPNSPVDQIILYTDPRPDSLNTFNYYNGLVVKVGDFVCPTTSGLDDASYAANKVTYQTNGIVFNCNGAVGNSIVLEYAGQALSLAEIVAYKAPKISLTNPRWGVDGNGLDNEAYTLPVQHAIDGLWAIHKNDGSNDYDFNFNGYTHDSGSEDTFSVDFASVATSVTSVVLYVDPRPDSINAFNYYNGLVVKVGNSVCTTSAGLDDASYAANKVTYQNYGIVFNCNGAVGNSITLEFAADKRAFAEIVAYN